MTIESKGKQLKIRINIAYDEYYTIRILPKNKYHMYIIVNDFILLMNIYYVHFKKMNLDIKNIDLKEEYFRCRRKKNGNMTKRVLMDYIPVKEVMKSFFNKKFLYSVHKDLLTIPEKVSVHFY